MSTTGAQDAWTFETITVLIDGPVLVAEILAPPMNLLGRELVRDLVAVIQRAEADDAYKVLVFTSGDPDYFISHVDLTRIAQYRQEAANLTGVPSIALLFRHLSASRLVTIAQIEGRVRSGGSEFVLACDMRFAARESAVFASIRVGVRSDTRRRRHPVPRAAHGARPRARGAVERRRLRRRARRTVRLDQSSSAGEHALGGFVRALAQRIGSFPAAGLLAIKERINEITLAPPDEFRRDSDLFAEEVRDAETQRRIRAATGRGLQTRRAEMEFADILDGLA